LYENAFFAKTQLEKSMEKLCKALSNEKRTRKKLMKLTPVHAQMKKNLPDHEFQSRWNK